MNTDLQAIKDYVLVKPDPKDTENKFNMGSTTKPQHTVVISIGEEVRDIKVGDTVLLPRYTGVTVMVNKEVHLLVREREVLVAFKEDKTWEL